MSKRWITLLAVVGILAAVITGGVVMAQETFDGEAATSTPTPESTPTTILSRVAAILGLDQSNLESAFQQARKDQKTEAYRAALDRKVEKGFITADEANEQFLWFQSRPDSVQGSFRQGGRRGPGFGQIRSFKGGRFGIRTRSSGGPWAGHDRSNFGWNGHAGLHSGQQEVAPTEPSSESDPTSQ